MTQFLPPNLLALFAPRDPIPYLPPASKLPHEKKSRGYSGVGQFLEEFEVSSFKYFNFTTLTEYFINRILKIHHLQQELKHEKNVSKDDVGKEQNR